jgi:DNA-binding CsgD family transcriptional regulator
VLHIALALYLFSFSLGIVLVVLSLLANVRFHSAVYGQLTAFFGAALLIVVVDMLKVYDNAAGIEFGRWIRYLYAALSLAGFGLFSWAMPLIVFHVCSLPLSARRRIVHLAIVIVAAAIGALHELFPGLVLEAMSAAVLVGVQVYGLVLLLPHLGGIKDLQLRKLLRHFCMLFIIGIAASGFQLAGSDLFGSEAAVRSLPIVQFLYFVGGVALLLAFAMRYPLARVADVGPTCTLPDAFISKYGISPRECEIVSLILRGYSNRMVAETLFISAMTVKNHIYHIYQKTGVGNKIQLLNMINPAK